MTIWFTSLTVLAELPGFGQTISMALRLDPDIYSTMQGSRDGLLISFAVVLLAALSEAFGQSLVLFLNRVRPFRYPLALGITGASNVIGYFLWSTVIWLTVWLIFGQQITFAATLIVVGLSYAPQLLGFIELTPYFGNFLGLMLTLWSTAAIVVAIWAGTGLKLWESALTGLATWSAIQLWRRSLGKPMYALGQWIERSVSGSALAYSVNDAVEGRLKREHFSQNWSLWWQHQTDALRSRQARVRKGEPPK
jgi:hypothetical protein